MDLFDDVINRNAEIHQQFLKDVYWLKGFALSNEQMILADLAAVISHAPLRHMTTKMGFNLSAAMTNCGDVGWVSSRKGYGYNALDPLTDAPWPAMPASFKQLAIQAAEVAGYANFVPEACLINQYQPAARMGLHQDKDELDFSQPIVSVSLGISAVFLFGGMLRNDKPTKIPLMHGDIIVWGRDARFNYHGIMPLKSNIHEVHGAYRFNLTFRKAA